MPTVIKRPANKPTSLRGDRNIRPVEPIDEAAWVWHPGLAVDEPAFLRFERNFDSDGTLLRFHVTADMRYEVFVDGERVGAGPDRGDVAHWSYSTYEVALQAGSHRMQAEVWWLGDLAPQALKTHRGGFCLRAEGAYDELLTTGRADWEVWPHHGWDMLKHPMEGAYHDIGCRQRIDARDWFDEADRRTAAVLRGPVTTNRAGVAVGGWCCYPSSLPELIFDPHQPTALRAVIKDGGAALKDVGVGEEDTCPEQTAPYQAMTAGEPVTVPAGTSVGLLLDLEDYVTGFSEVDMEGGEGAVLSCEFAESLYEAAPGPDERPRRTEHKGHRGEVAGKIWRGFGHQWICDGRRRTWCPYWWTSGRYLMLRVVTSNAPLTLHAVRVREYRYPLEGELELESGDPFHQKLLPLCLRALQCCAHESFCDCPYYEQMMYVGDTRLEMLVMRMVNADNRLSKRALELFDFSRADFGFVSERTTSRMPQLCSSFAAIHTLALRDFAYWHCGEEDFLRERLPGSRANLDHFIAYVGDRGLVEREPGWTFIDWVDKIDASGWAWESGYAPGYRNGRCCANLNLFYLLALQAQAQLEHYIGFPRLAEHYEALARDLARAIHDAFWSEESGLMADDLGKTFFSQHANCLALIAGVIGPEEKDSVICKVLEDHGLAPCTIYFKHYLFEALTLCGRGDALLREIATWKTLLNLGLKTTVEKPEPTRSDCHAWGAHPLYHLVAGVAGLRPVEPGGLVFEVTPRMGDLESLSVTLPHPLGIIQVTLRNKNGEVLADIDAPDGVTCLRGRQPGT